LPPSTEYCRSTRVISESSSMLHLTTASVLPSMSVGDPASLMTGFVKSVCTMNLTVPLQYSDMSSRW